MMKWKYMNIWIGKNESLSFVDLVGRQGWEAFAVTAHETGFWWYFKKPLDEIE